MWQFYVALGVVSVWWLLLRPRTGGKDAPPMVLSSTVVKLPLVGVLVEFLKSPNDMMRRCYQDYGAVFTIPVSTVEYLLALPCLALPCLALPCTSCID
jgi:hypothetical protein